MKNPERVAELLAELRALTETDFERHRIDVLERDLSAPPTVEVIDDKHQRFDGVNYYKNKDGHFATGTGIHRAVWQYYNGKIPEGYEIHHIDENPVNNDIKNLTCLQATKHHSHHMQKRESQEYTCQFCGQKFLSNGIGKIRFCSTKCNNAWHTHCDKETRKCVVCGKDFQTRRQSRTVCCSPSCGVIFAHRNSKKPSVKQICPACGKEFTLKYPSTKQICCSQSCAAKLRCQQRKQAQAVATV